MSERETDGPAPPRGGGDRAALVDRFEAVFEASPDALLVVDGRRRVRLGNAAAAALLGLSREALLGRELGVAVPDEGRSEVELPRPDGSARCAEIRTARLEWEGEPATLVALRDVTERRLAEARLSRSREELASVLDNVGVGIVGLDRELRVTEMNRQMRAWFPGFEPGAGRRCFTAFRDPPRDGPCDFCQTTKTLEDGQVHEAEAEVRVGRRTRRFRLVSSPVRDAEGRVAGAIEFVEDVTERRELEAQVRQAQRLESVGRLAGGVAHDLNNLLSVILPRTAFALEDPTLTGEAREDVEAVRQAAERARTLTRQLLAFGRKQVLQPKPLDLGEVVHGLVKLVRRVIDEDLALEVEARTGLPAVHADPGQIEQALLNLCVNARDAMPGGGTLRIEAAEVEVGEGFAATRPWAIRGRFVRLRVSDTGTGMDPDTLAVCFEPFFTTKPADKGTGLGLASVYGIVKQHGGMVDVSSEPGRGTTFDLFFPLAEPGAEDADALPGEDERAAPPGGRETILLAEDEPTVRRVATRILERAGYRVLAAADGVEALELFEAHREEIDLLVLDAVMPRLGGGEVRDRVRLVGSDVPVLFCSGYSPEALVTRLSDRDLVSVVTKPFDTDELLRGVRRMLRRRSLVPAR